MGWARCYGNDMIHILFYFPFICAVKNRRLARANQMLTPAITDPAEYKQDARIHLSYHLAIPVVDHIGSSLLATWRHLPELHFRRPLGEKIERFAN